VADSTRNREDDRLDSWKEIAAHLKREVRTVQRWEKHEGLPVHRKRHDSLSSIYAFKSELDQWWSEGRTAPDQRQEMSQPRSPVLAILPLRNLSNDSSQEYFADGMTEELISQVGRAAPDRLSVIASATALMYKGSSKSPARIGAELGVRFLLGGSVRRADNRIRTTVELVNATDQSQVWTESYDSDLSNILQLQTDVAHAVAERVLRTVLPSASPPGGGAMNARAYDHYLRARFLWNRRNEEDIKRALDNFQRAIKLEPSYAVAHAGLADCYSVLASLQFAAMAPNEAMPKARAAAARALELDPGLAHAYTSAGAVCLFYDWDLEAARKLFAHALELNPGYTTARQWYAEYLATCERLEDSIDELRRTQALDPLSLVTRTAIEATRYFQRRYDEVIELARATLELEPNFALAYFQLGRAYVQQGNFSKAIAELDRAYKMSGEAAGFGMMLGYAYAAAGRRRHAEQMLDALARRAKRRYIPAFYFAAIYAGLRDVEHTIAYLLKARDERCDYLLHVNHEPAADVVRSDPRLAELLPKAMPSPEDFGEGT
jgi:TolB-like protein/Flp pilus assembly protein TadD